MKLSTSGGGLLGQQSHEGDNKCLNSELWHACAGPLVSLPTMGTRVVYFPQGHSDQVAATTNKEIDGHIPNYPSLPPQLICQLHNVTMHADLETDEVYAQMTLQPLTLQEQKDTFLPVELGISSKQPTNYFCKTLTASDTSTHGGFSVPRRAAEKVFPPLDFSQQPPCQELIARDLHDVEWKFRHIFRGQPKRHLLTTGWSVFVSAKRLVTGDSILFIWNEKNQLLLGIRRAIRPQTMMPSSVLSSDSMHIGLLAAAAHAAATNSCFTVFYNPRACPSEFVIPLSKYVKAVFHTRVSVGMRFRMLFETEESSVRRYMGTITGISDLDPARWPDSHWRSVKVGWDESTAGERQPRVSLWEIEPLTTFPMYPSLFPLRLKRPWHPGVSSLLDNRDEGGTGSMWLRDDNGHEALQSLNFQHGNMLPWMQQRIDPVTLFTNDQTQQYQAMLQNYGSSTDPMKQQFIQFQQFPQQTSTHNPMLLQQQIQAMQHPQSQISQESMVRQMLQQQLHNQQDGPPQLPHQQQTYQDRFQTQSDHQQMQNADVASLLHKKSDFTDSNLNKYGSYVPSSSGMQNMPSGGNLLNLSNSGQSQTSWVPEENTDVELENYGLVAQNHTFFGVNVDSSGLLLPTTIPPPFVGTSSSIDDDASVFHGSMYNNCIQGSSSELLNNAEDKIGSPNMAPQTFVKVYKSGTVGRSLDISRFSSYEELRKELGQMFRVEGGNYYDDPFRSGWQLVFVDRENEMLLLGDDPWEVFVNNVWYIKILSPEDVQKMGKQGESFGNGNMNQWTTRGV